MEQFKNELKQTFNQSLLSYVSEYKLQLQLMVDEKKRIEIEMKTEMETKDTEWKKKYGRLHQLYTNECALRQSVEEENVKLTTENQTLQMTQEATEKECILYKNTIIQLQETYKQGKARWTATIAALKEQHQMEMGVLQQNQTNTSRKHILHIDDLKQVILAQRQDMATLEQQIESMKKQLDELNIYKVQSVKLESELERERKTCASWKTAYFNQLPTKKR
jgi:hypothetical protein